MIILDSQRQTGGHCPIHHTHRWLRRLVDFTIGSQRLLVSLNQPLHDVLKRTRTDRVYDENMPPCHRHSFHCVGYSHRLPFCLVFAWTAIEAA